MSEKMLKVNYGALAPELEKQLNEQGFTLGEKADLMEKLKYSLLMLHIHGVLTDSQERIARERLHKKVVTQVLKEYEL